MWICCVFLAKSYCWPDAMAMPMIPTLCEAKAGGSLELGVGDKPGQHKKSGLYGKHKN